MTTTTTDIEKKPTTTSETTTSRIEPAPTMIPGTVLLVDFSHKQDLSHSAAHQEIVLIPTPTPHPDDPLNWTPSRKWFALFIVCLWSFVLGAATLTPTITYGALIPLWRVDTTFLNIGTAVSIFNLGFFNIFLSPLSQKYGRRPVYFFSTVVCVISQIVCATANNKAAWMVGRVLLGAGAAPFEQLPALSVDDQFFVHERGLGLSYYILAISTGSFLGPVAGGFVIQSMGWRCEFLQPTIERSFVMLMRCQRGIRITGHFPWRNRDPHPPRIRGNQFRSVGRTCHTIRDHLQIFLDNATPLHRAQVKLLPPPILHQALPPSTSPHRPLVRSHVRFRRHLALHHVRHPLVSLPNAIQLLLLRNRPHTPRSHGRQSLHHLRRRSGHGSLPSLDGSP